MNDALDLSTSVAANAALVPAGYAEKAMASLMQLHAELMEEKERRVDLFRTLMQKEQALSDLKMYVKLLEQKVAAAEAPKAAAPAPELPAAPARAPAPASPVVPTPAPTPVAASVEAPRRERPVPPPPPRAKAAPAPAATPAPAPAVQAAPASSRLQNLPPLPKRAEGWKAW